MKKNLESDSIRKHYYEASDNIYGLEAKLEKLNDQAGLSLIKEMISIKNKLSSHLDKNYNWD